MTTVVIEGWRGINHSIAMVNQYQILELARLPEIDLAHRDMAFANPAWNPVANDAGFGSEDRAIIEALLPPEGRIYDVAYSICSPIRPAVSSARKIITFFVTEFGFAHRKDFFEGGHCDIAAYMAGNNIAVVPSRWVKGKMLEFGFPEDKVYVVPHGVDSRVFSPPVPEQRRAVREQLGLQPDHFAFLNLGAMTWNKGLDILLRAFSVVRGKHANARLVLKDQKAMYGIGADTTLQKMMAESPDILREEVRQSIVLVTSTLGLRQMGQLYGAVDQYVSPYRAEGFNLPVIESIASGTPVIVTRGGATDDFCNPNVAMGVDADMMDNSAMGIRESGQHLSPRLDALIDAMEQALLGRGLSAEAFRCGRDDLIRRYSWRECTAQLVRLFSC